MDPREPETLDEESEDSRDREENRAHEQEYETGLEIREHKEMTGIEQSVLWSPILLRGGKDLGPPSFKRVLKCLISGAPHHSLSLVEAANDVEIPVTRILSGRPPRRGLRAPARTRKRWL